MISRVSKSVSWVFALACVALLPIALVAQDTAKPAANAPATDSPSKWDIFVGYSYLAPKGTVVSPSLAMPTSTRASTMAQLRALPAISISMSACSSRETSTSCPRTTGTAPDQTNSNDDFSGGSGGVIFRIPSAQLTPWFHGLVGTERIGGPHYQKDAWGGVVTLGGGLDYNTPWFHHHLAIRLAQVGLPVLSRNVRHGHLWRPRQRQRCAFERGLCFPHRSNGSAAAGYAGVLGQPHCDLPRRAGHGDRDGRQLAPKLNAVYSWSGTGVTGSGTTASVATASLAPGTYTVKGEVKEGPKPTSPDEIARLLGQLHGQAL